MSARISIMPDNELDSPEEHAAQEHVREIMEPVRPGALQFPAKSEPIKIKIADRKPPVEPVVAAAAVDPTPVLTPSLTPEQPAPPAPELAPKPAPSEEFSNPASDDGVDQLLGQPVGALADDHAVADPPPDPETDKAVEEIAKHEGDEILAAQDNAQAHAVVMKPGFFEWFKNGIQSWWDDPRKRYLTLAFVAVLIAVVAFVPSVRIMALNTVGVRAKLAVTVQDATTNLPLKNAAVTVAGETAKTDGDGKAVVSGVKLGEQQVSISKEAFAMQKTTTTFGVGTKTLPDVSLKAVGTQYTLLFTDYLSGKPVTKAEVTSGEANAIADATGKAILTVQPGEAGTLQAVVVAEGYRDEKIQISTTSQQPTTVQLVPAQKSVFVSKQSGKYDLYAVDVDGKNRQLLLAGSGNETPEITLSVNAEGSRAALVSTRDNQRDNQGYLLSTLTIVNLSDQSNVTVDHSQQIRLLGWSGGRLLYVQTVAGTSAANPNRQKIISYDSSTAKRQQLASTNYFNGVLLADGTVYYAVSATEPGKAANFNKVKADGTGKQIVSNQEVWTLLRTSPTALSLQTTNAWLDYTLGASSTKPGLAPPSYVSRQYVESTDGSKSLWVDNRDGKGVLLVYDVKSGKETVLATRAGLSLPVRWLNENDIVFRSVTKQETADYVVSLQGGEPKKIGDVTATAGAGQN
jgi:hypothetical protein